jgi:hypothetical protein
MIPSIAAIAIAGTTARLNIETSRRAPQQCDEDAVDDHERRYDEDLP